MYNRGTMICLSVTGISALLLFFYFRNKISSVEDKLDKLTKFIEEYNKPAEFVVSETPGHTPEMVAFSNMEDTSYNKELIEVSDEDDDDDSDSDDSINPAEHTLNDKIMDDIVRQQYAQKVESNEENVETIKQIEISEEKEEEKEKQESGEESDEESGEESGEEEETGEESEEESEEEEDENNDLGNEDTKKIVLEELPDYKKFTVAMLKDACRDKGLSGYRNLRKHDLVELLETSQAN